MFSGLPKDVLILFYKIHSFILSNLCTSQVHFSYEIINKLLCLPYFVTNTDILIVLIIFFFRVNVK